MMNAKNFNFPYEIKATDGIVRYLNNQCYVVQLSDQDYAVYDAITHKMLGNNFRGKGISKYFSYKDDFYFTLQASGSKTRYKYSPSSLSLDIVQDTDFMASPLGIRNNRAFFASSEMYVSDISKTEKFKAQPFFEDKAISCRCRPVLGDSSVVLYSEYQVLSGYSLDGEQLWSKTLEDFDIYPKPDFWSSAQQFGRKIEGWKNYAIFEVKPFQAVCIDISTGEQRWAVEHCVDFQYCVADGVLYGIANGMFTSVDIETGDVILSVPIEKDWIQGGVMESRPFPVLKATRTHLWCGFAQAQGVCAINRETGQIDYQEFVGLTLNLYPQIRSNQIFLSFAAGGIGLNTQSGGNYVLIGDGGFIEDEEKDVFY